MVICWAFHEHGKKMIPVISLKHPEVELVPKKTSSAVKRMIARALALGASGGL
jgi:hypothetical protein